MSLHLDYRPKTLDDIVGNETAVASLASVLDRKNVPPSFFFTGIPGSGKTTLARIIKNYLDVSDMDFYEYNTANTRGIDTIRGINVNCGLSPMDGKKKVYLLDECHMITGPALESLLKLLEEPPSHVHFILCTSEPQTIKANTLKAIRRRCHECELKPLIRGQLIRLMKSICKKEEIDFPVSVIRKIATSCWGSAGQALSMLDSVIGVEDEETAEEAIENLIVSEASVVEICRLLINGKLSAINKWNKIRKLIPKLSGEPESIRYAILGYLNKVILNHGGLPINLAAIVACFTDSFMYTGKAGVTLGCFYACLEKSEEDVPF